MGSPDDDLADDDLPDIDPQALARAEAALADLSHDYLTWAATDIAAMRACLAEVHDHPGDGKDGLARLHHIAHDMKGQAGTFGYPLVTEIGLRLCRLLQECAIPDLAVVAAHVDALADVVEQRLAGDGGEAGRNLLGRLE